jgi:steroid delta-isomerase-like uncharacterized protein
MKGVDAIIVWKGFVAALETQDFEKTASFFTDDCVYEDIPMGAVCHGVKEFIDIARMVRRTFPDRSWKITSIFSDGNKIATEAVWSGTNTHSDDPARPPTGKHVSVRTVSITDLRDGKIWKNSDYYDGLSVQKQLGLLPETSKNNP